MPPVPAIIGVRIYGPNKVLLYEHIANALSQTMVLTVDDRGDLYFGFAGETIRPPYTIEIAQLG